MRTRSRTPVILGIIAAIACLGLSLLVIVGVIVGVVYLADQGDEQRSAEGSPAAQETVAPPGIDEDQPYLELSSGDGPVVDVYIDFLCPHCATFSEAQTPDLVDLVEDEQITLRMHPRAMLDESAPAGYSSRAANAAVCAYAEDPGAWFPVQEALFENQPQGADIDDDELISLVEGAADVRVADCVTSGTYIPWLLEVVEPEASVAVSGTPTVLIDGEQFVGDLTRSGSLREEIDAA